jgi:hypothetical protein
MQTSCLGKGGVAVEGRGGSGSKLFAGGRWVIVARDG